MDPLQVTLSLGGIVLIIVAAYYATWFISVKASGRGRGKLRNKNINLIDRFAISKDKSFCIVEIAGKVYVVGVTNQSMTLIDTLNALEFAENQEENRETLAFRMTPGVRIADQIVKKLASFLRNSTRRRGNSEREREGGEGFADSMRKAAETDGAGQPDRVQADGRMGGIAGDPAYVSPEGKE
ncbi:MAG: flagellar biosynthetic protein FliO [Oscillospiraceae bacterium]|nr:flagellar biosynthetic protein FliO [Oscillospiraceae bacterium]